MISRSHYDGIAAPGPLRVNLLLASAIRNRALSSSEAQRSCHITEIICDGRDITLDWNQVLSN